MRRTLAAPGLAAVLGMALLLTACGKTNAHNNTAGETVSTALFDFSITDVSLVESYPGIDIPDGECLVRMRLNIKNTSSQTACIGVCRNRDHRGSCCTRSSGGGCTGQHR